MSAGYRLKNPRTWQTSNVPDWVRLYLDKRHRYVGQPVEGAGPHVIWVRCPEPCGKWMSKQLSESGGKPQITRCPACKGERVPPLTSRGVGRDNPLAHLSGYDEPSTLQAAAIKHMEDG